MPRLSDLTQATVQDITAADGLYMGNLDGAVMDMILPVPVLVQYLATQNIGGGGGGGGEGGASSLAQITDWPAGVTAEEVAWLDGVTSSIQQQLNSRSLTGHGHPLSEITNWPGTVSVTHVSYLAGATSNIQTQITARALTSHTHPTSFDAPTRVLTAGGTTATLPISTPYIESVQDGAAGLMSATDKSEFDLYPIPLPLNHNFNNGLPLRNRTYEYTGQSGVTNLPPNGGNYGVVKMVRNRSTDRQLMLWTDLGAATTGTEYIRVKNDGGWGAWRQRAVESDVTGITGAVVVNGIVSLTTAAYDAIEVYDPNILYVKVG